MSEESKLGEPKSGGSGGEQTEAASGKAVAKGKSKKKRVKSSGKDASPVIGESSSESNKLPSPLMDSLLKSNPSLQSEVRGLGKEKAEDMLRRLNMSDLLTGMSIGGKNQKDMASYKFWQTQPVPRFDEQAQGEEGPIKMIDPEQVPKAPSALLEGFEWVTMDLTQTRQLEEVFELLTGHYVEDDEAMFRFNYSTSFLNWALKAPGWRKDWHIGVRASQSQKLVAFISGVPVQLRVRESVLNCSEINFLCIHKKLRSKRLAPVLIKEITRRCYILGIFQAIYTAGVVLPKPVSSCRYFHRSLDWLKLYEVGFSSLPARSTKPRQITKYQLPGNTATIGLRPIEHKDVEAVLDLLGRYLARFDMAPVFTKEEVDHWMLHKNAPGHEQVVWTYVIEDPESHKITDFFSFYCLESSVIGNKKHDVIRAAYLFYYASETAFPSKETESENDTRAALKLRLNALINDALILAKRLNFDVFNGLTLLDNGLFLEQQKFGPGDGQLHYYLYNYRTAPIAGGVDAKNSIDDKGGSGVGVVML
ncbi:glycylpeptide N-tetradecanoyltransferase [Glutinoglossum americanum]|uniref:Glycylpeptide N-tetradecanoyltransferase n=1 Tax=Glutinoglossum americanum TaxID=1670608 RepID=A0A9P8I4D5_9PEZI|nr:glycylpeptide N-tetradecanoyltransferase [Glutinoglossum americanum]